MKKVCFVANSLVGGGAEKAVIKLAREFASHGHEVHIIIMENIIDYDVDKLAVHCLSDSDRSRPTLLKKVFDSNPLGRLVTKVVRRLMEQHKFSYYILHKNEINKLQSKIKELGHFEAVFSNLSGADFLCIAAKVENLYCFIRGDIYSMMMFPWPWTRNLKFRKIREWLFLAKLRNFYHGQNLITVAEELIDTTLALGIKPASIQYIYNIYDFDKIRKLGTQYQVEEEDYIMYSGRFVLEKRLDLLIDAYKLSDISHKLLLLGHGPDEAKIHEAVKKHNLQGRVVIKDFVTNPYPYVKKASAFILASEAEGIANVLIEALILGTPAVSTSCKTGPKEILTGELAEFLSPVGDTQALANNIRKVIDQPPQIKDEHIAKFHKDVNIRKYLAIAAGTTKQN